MIFWLSLVVMFVAPGVFHRVMGVIFWCGFALTLTYLAYIFIGNPVGTEGWVLRDAEWYWLAASPFIGGAGFIFLIAMTLGFSGK